MRTVTKRGGELREGDMVQLWSGPVIILRLTPYEGLLSYLDKDWGNLRTALCSSTISNKTSRFTVFDEDVFEVFISGEEWHEPGMV